MSSPSGSEPVIELVSLEQLDEIAPLFEGYLDFYQRPGLGVEGRAFLQHRLERDESVVLLARCAGTACGFTQLYGLFSSVRLQPRWVLNDLFVEPSFRRRGVAKALLQEAAAFVRARGGCSLTLETDADNHSAQALYQSLGWELEQGLQHYELHLR